MGKTTDRINKMIMEKEAKRSKRDQLNSFMTTFEWRNVEMAAELGRYMKTGGSLFYYPFISQTFNLFKITKNSIQAAHQYDSLKRIMFSEYGAMAAFINIFTACEWMPKGIMSAFMRPFLDKKNDSEMQKHFANYYQSYAAKLETLPFYDHNYGEARSELREAYKSCHSKTWTDFFTYYSVMSDLFLKGWISKPLQSNFHDPNNIVPATTDILVKFNINTMDHNVAKRMFKDKIQKLESKAQAKIIGDHVYAEEKKKPGKSYTSIYALLEVPRYRDFMKTVDCLTVEKIKIKKMAGNDHVQVKCEIKAPDDKSLQQSLNNLKKSKEAKLLYSYEDNIEPNRRMCLFDVPTKKLQQAVKELNEDIPNMTVNFIHNF